MTVEEEGGVAPVVYKNKHRCLVFGSRGMTARFRHLLDDIRALVPHHKKESKVCYYFSST